LGLKFVLIKTQFTEKVDKCCKIENTRWTLLGWYCD